MQYQNEPNQIYGHVHADCEKMMQTQPQARIEWSHSTHTTAAEIHLILNQHNHNSL